MSGNRLHDREGDPDARSRDEVVGERIAEEAVEDREDEQRRAHDPVELAGLAECPGEEDAEHVDDDRAHEDVRRPVVHLAHEQAAAYGKAQVQCRGEGLGDRLSAKRRVRALVDDFLARRDKVEGEEDSRSEKHDERVEGDFAYQERPVIREDLVEHLAARARDPEPLVEPVEKGVNHCPAPSTPVQQARRTRPGHGNNPRRRCTTEAEAAVAAPARRWEWRHR